MATSEWSKKTSDVPEGLRRQWRADRALRPAMRSPGRPDPSRVVQRQFWRLIATRAGTVISLRRSAAVVALARSGARACGSAGEVERDDCQHQPGRVGGEHPGGQVGQRGVLQVGVHLLDDRVPTVGIVRCDRVEQAGVGGGEERVEAPYIEQEGPGRRPCSARR